MKGGILVISCVCFLISCSILKTEEDPQVTFPAVKKRTLTIDQGHVKKVYIEDYGDFKETLRCDGEEVGFDETEKGLRVYLSADYHYKQNSYECQVELSKKGKTKEFPLLEVQIESYPFEKERLNVDKKHVELSQKAIERWKKEKKELERVYSSLTLDRAYFRKPFSEPLDSKMTSAYGKERIFNNQKSSWHSGIDFRAWHGTPIPVANRGKVVFTGDLYFNGNTVIVDHGLGIATLYCHLKKIKAQKGEVVAQGDIIGLAGNTGRSTAPHLHWGVRVQGHWINGFSLIDQGI